MEANNNRIIVDNPNSQGENSEKSSIDKMFGNHTNSVIVAILFLCTLIAFLIYMCVFQEKLSDTITTGFISLESALAGYFVASLRKK